MFQTLRNRIDWVMMAALVPICLVGILGVSGDGGLLVRQIIWIALSLVLMCAVTLLDTRLLTESKLLLWIYVIGCGLLLLLFVLGNTVKGATSWFHLGAFAFQPADPMKIVLILLLAKYLSRRNTALADIRYLIGSILYVSIPFILVFLQPDFGSSIVYIGIWGVMVLTSGISKKHILGLFGIAVALFLGAWLFVLEPYQKARIMNFVNPTADVQKTGYNVRQSMIAVGSGQIIGKGFGYGTQSHLKFLPEYKTDFIFAAFAEEWGFLGAIVVVMCYLIVFYRILKHAEHGGSNFETLYALGFLGFLFVHTVINMGMNIGIMPVTGIALPFASYGGSHLLTEFLGLGLLFSMRSRSRRAHPDQLRPEYQGIGTDW